ncbi:hypothetical protein GIY30_02135 [Gordonia sp. HNM0687]|uniref:Uncharacterized protein n=1 Tax=Gordonia mangrovi TaxID=2665643 RepID=A0A6L7GJN7_9ACTN|nr:hypothetical protein [Gordonia mangrovi]MXP20170.1 hypothetical protein [Gordonia mangrovi]UVF79223.1 hypothetical protein NWF22_05105 [Gordonia mangrovi]
MSVLDFRLNRETGDVRSLLGMNTRVAWAIAAFFLAAEATLFATSAGDLAAVWPGVTLLALLAMGAVAILAVRQDPLPAPFAAAVVITTTPAAYACFHVLPVPNSSPDQLWMFGAITMLCTWLCVRGRVGTAWLTMAGLIAASILWTVTTDRGALEGFAASVVNLGPLLMSTLFAATIRPAARDIYELRRRAVEQSATRAAAVAAVAERDQRLRALNAEVTPLLQRIADDAPLTAAERERCRTLEAQIRDSLRAPILAGTPTVAAAASRARARGVEVIMVDGHALDDADDSVRTSVLSRIADELDCATQGSAVIRILPPGRALCATVVVDGPRAVLRVEFMADGTARDETSAAV